MKIKKLTAAITALLLALTGGMTAVADSNSVTFTDRQDNWNYPNAHEEFGFRNFLLDEDRQLLLDSLQNTEKFSLSKIWQMEDPGICYGMLWMLHSFCSMRRMQEQAGSFRLRSM